MMEWLLEWDRICFLGIHLGAQHVVLDWIAPLLRNKIFWVPLYAFIVFYLWFNVRPWFWAILLAVAAVVGVSDTISSKVIKPAVGRLRPCNDPALQDQVRPLVSCGSGKSFTSSHATNHFALAMFFATGLGYLQGRWRWLWFVWAGLIALSQVYVGVHYPLDILGGALLGLGIGYLVTLLFRRFIRPKSMPVV